MNEIKGYYLSKLNLQEGDIVLMTIDPDEASIALYEDYLQRIADIVKPHPVLVMFKGIKISKVNKEKAIKMLQETEILEKEDVSAS